MEDWFDAEDEDYYIGEKMRGIDKDTRMSNEIYLTKYRRKVSQVNKFELELYVWFYIFLMFFNTLSFQLLVVSGDVLKQRRSFIGPRGKLGEDTSN